MSHIAAAVRKKRKSTTPLDEEEKPVGWYFCRLGIKILFSTHT